MPLVLGRRSLSDRRRVVCTMTDASKTTPYQVANILLNLWLFVLFWVWQIKLSDPVCSIIVWLGAWIAHMGDHSA